MRQIDKRISKNELFDALNEMRYHKTIVFIERCEIEEDSKDFSVSTIKDVAFSMLDKDLERELYRKLNI